MSITPNANSPWLKKCRHFANKIIVPNRSRYDSENQFPIDVHQEARLWGMIDQDFPTALGGTDLSGTEAVAGAEILASACAPIAFTLGFNRGALHPVLLAGTDKQKQQFII